MGEQEPHVRDRGGAAQGRLLARPPQSAPADAAEARPGLYPLRLGAKRDGVVYVPRSYRPGRPASLVLMLHGAGGSAQRGLNPLRALADAAGLLMLAPDSRRETWDVIQGGYGPDIVFIDRALAHVFSRYSIDPKRLAVEGFSDGASYALSLGVANGDLFSHVVAFSPGFMAPAGQKGMPRIFMSHGTKDGVLPIDRCSRRIAPQLKRAGYDVRYREFEGGHTVPLDIAQEAVAWFNGERRPAARGAG